jgi:hypothetical protein
MAYGNITEVYAGPIAERRYRVSDTITTTGVSSCIVVVSRVGQRLLGIHLSLFGEDGMLEDTDADEVGRIMQAKNADMYNVHIFGEIQYWGHGQPPGYARLMSVLGYPPDHRRHQRDGIITIQRGHLG